MAEILNYMETIAEDILEELLADRQDICKCKKCKLDILVWALNRLPPKYVVTDKGRLYTKLKEQETQFHTDVIKELTKAIIQISKNPQH
ncbi:MAG: late competence development ComFB family protein [Candidatus Omnitrophota bacterium]